TEVSCLGPVARAAVAEGTIELTIPRLGRHAGLAGAAGLRRLGWVEQPGTTDQLLLAQLEHLEAKHVDGDIALAQVADDALAAGIQLGGDDDDLVALVQRLGLQRRAEARLEV